MRALVALAFALFSSVVLAGINAYEFSSPGEEARFRQLIQELRCPKCQNQNIADSDAPLAKDLKDIIYDKVRAGESDAQILAYMQKRYGDFILYRPPVKPSTWLLWFGPGVLLLGGIIGLLIYIRRRDLVQTAVPAVHDQKRLEALLVEAEGADTVEKS